MSKKGEKRKNNWKREKDKEKRRSKLSGKS